MGTYVDRQLRALHDVQVLLSRHKRAAIVDMNEEAQSEVSFVRFFGTKVKTIRWSHRMDLVGLMLLGNHNGIVIVRGPDGLRRVRPVDVNNGTITVLSRELVLKERDSLTHLRRGLLNWVK